MNIFESPLEEKEGIRKRFLIFQYLSLPQIGRYSTGLHLFYFALSE